MSHVWNSLLCGEGGKFCWWKLWPVVCHKYVWGSIESKHDFQGLTYTSRGHCLQAFYLDKRDSGYYSPRIPWLRFRGLRHVRRVLFFFGTTTMELTQRIGFCNNAVLTPPVFFWVLHVGKLAYVWVHVVLGSHQYQLGYGISPSRPTPSLKTTGYLLISWSVDINALPSTMYISVWLV